MGWKTPDRPRNDRVRAVQPGPRHRANPHLPGRLGRPAGRRVSRAARARAPATAAADSPWTARAGTSHQVVKPLVVDQETIVKLRYQRRS